MFEGIVVANYDYKQILLSATVFEVERNLKVVSLFSPSDNWLRVLKKGLIATGVDIATSEYRFDQYRQLLA